MRPSTEFVQAKFKNQKLLVAEIGVQCGNNARTLLSALDFEQLHLIDIWDLYQRTGHYGKGSVPINFDYYYPGIIKEFGNKPNISIHKLASLDACKKFVDEYFDFVYLDACHSYEAVTQDIATWFPKVKVGCILGGHDYFKVFPGVIKAVDEFIQNSGHKLYQVHHDWWIVKGKMDTDKETLQAIRDKRIAKEKRVDKPFSQTVFFAGTAKFLGKKNV